MLSPTLCLVLAAASVPFVKLPLKALVLYENGLGYFERRGPLRPGQVADIPLEPGQLDDALKSAVILSKQGVAAVEFTPPLAPEAARALAGMPAVDLMNDLAVVLAALKGVDVVVTNSDGVVARGRVLEVADEQEHDLKGNAIPAPTLLVFGEPGLQRVRLNEIASVRPTAAGVVLAWDRAMRAASTQPQMQSLKVRAGTGATEVALGYTTEAPVWRATYRLVQTKEKTRLQAFALVHNDSDEPWAGVKVTLASGRPASFLYPLAGPRYGRREMIAPADGLDAAPQLATAEARQHLTGHSGKDISLGSLSTHGRGGGSSGYGSGHVSLGGTGADTRARQPSDLLTEGLSPLEPAAVSEAGELFLYTVKEPVTLGAHKSALLPIIDDGISAEAVTVIGDETAQPQLAMRLLNSTPLTLEEGTVSVFADGTYAGEAQLDRLKPHEVRILQHGEDLDLEASIEQTTQAGPVQAVRPVASEGLIELHRIERRVHRLTLTSRSAKKRTVLYTLDSEGYRIVSGAEEDVRSPEQPRYARFTVEPRQEKKIEVVEEGAWVDRLSVTDLSSTQLTELLALKVPLKVHEALTTLQAQVQRVEKSKVRQQQIDERVKELNGDVTRLRETLAAAGKGGTSQTADALGAKLLTLEEELTALRAERKEHDEVIAAAQQMMLAQTSDSHSSSTTGALP
ncbi:MAG: hypothetical protein K1X64_18095 [Myxococcaceae bacterium]|nr:hypothetical protein [Myxococcaceae bacterium]